MLIFIDTEFTDLVPHAKLISIALVDEFGDSFYAELTDTYTVAQCSGFVKENVLPHLRGGKHRMTSYECAFSMGNWIEDKGVACMLACDNPSWDVPFLNRLLSDCYPNNLNKEMIAPVFLPDNIVHAVIREHSLQIHNALDDAKIMQLGMQLLSQ